MDDQTIPLYLPNYAKEQIEKAKQGASDSDHRFISHLTEGYKWQFYVLNAFVSNGFWGTVHPFQLRPDYGNRQAYSDDYDVIVGPHPHEVGTHWSRSLDVKSRTRAFTMPSDFPFESIIIEPESRFNARKNLIPDAWVHVSKYTGGILVIGKDSLPSWDVEMKKGKRYVTSPAEHIMSLEDYIETLPTPIHQPVKD